MLRLVGGPFFTHNTGTHDGEQCVRAQAGVSWLPLAGEWSVPGGPLVVSRAELPGIDTERAAQLIEAVDGLLYEPDVPLPVYKPNPIKALPDLAKGEPLLFGDAQAVRKLKDNGYGICPVPWGSDRPSDKWWMTPSLGAQWGKGTAEMGVGGWRRGPGGIGTHIAALEVTGADAEQVRKADAAIVANLGAGLLRMAADGTRLRLYSLPRYGAPKHDAVWTIRPEAFMLGEGVHVRVISDSAVVFSGTDASGQPFTWLEGSPLTTLLKKLPMLQLMTDQRGAAPDYLRTALVAAINAPADAAPATTRRRARA